MRYIGLLTYQQNSSGMSLQRTVITLIRSTSERTHFVKMRLKLLHFVKYASASPDFPSSLALFACHRGVCTLFAAVLVGYLLLLVVPPREVHKVTMVYIIGVIVTAHVYRMLTDYGGYHLDFTG